MSLVLRLPREMHLCRSSANLPRLPEMPQNPHVLLTFGKVQNPLRLPRKTTSEPSKAVRAFGVLNILTLKCASRTFRHLSFQKWSERGVFCTFWLQKVLRATTACAFSTSQLPKVVWTWCVLYILTSKCASRHNGVHFFNISTSKSALNPVFFYTFGFETCFVPQRRVLFQHLNFQKWPEHGVLCTFWLGNVLRATMACNFSDLANLLFDPPEPQIIGKPQCFATFLPFRAPASSFFCLFRSLWLFPPLLFLSILSEVWLLNCLRLLNEIALYRFAYDTDVFSRRARRWGSSQRRCGDCQLLALGCRWRRCLIRGIYENLWESHAMLVLFGPFHISICGTPELGSQFRRRAFWFGRPWWRVCRVPRGCGGLAVLSVLCFFPGAENVVQARRELSYIEHDSTWFSMMLGVVVGDGDDGWWWWCWGLRSSSWSSNYDAVVL